MKLLWANIRNFQSHRETKVSFADGVNAIVGDSDQGKSSILRAIRWCLFNVPGGEEFVSYWGGETAVELGFNTGLEVGRYRSKSRNEYILSIPGQESQRFAGFGRENVPDQVKAALGFHEFNTRFQHQGAFLLCENSGEVSRYLNRIAKLDIIDSTLASLKVSQSAEKQKADAEAATVKRLSEALKPFEFLDQAEIHLKALESQDGLLRAKINAYNRLFDLWEEGERISQELETASRVLPFIKEVELAYWREQDIVVRKARANTLDDILSQIDGMTEQISKVSAVLPVDLRDLFREKDSLERKQLENNRLIVLVRTIGAVEEDLVNARRRVAELTREYSQAFPDICPLCGYGFPTKEEVHHEAAGKTKPGKIKTDTRDILVPKRAAR